MLSTLQVGRNHERVYTLWQSVYRSDKHWKAIFVEASNSSTSIEELQFHKWFLFYF
jgi:hypothetical protein